MDQTWGKPRPVDRGFPNLGSRFAVIPAGLEPATYGLGNRRSIQLSYGTALRPRFTGSFFGCPGSTQFIPFGLRNPTPGLLLELPITEATGLHWARSQER